MKAMRWWTRSPARAMPSSRLTPWAATSSVLRSRSGGIGPSSIAFTPSLPRRPRMASDWRFDKQWSDLFIPSIKVILAEVFVREASLRQDRREATDLVVFTVTPHKIACRVRDVRYAERYPYDITIRTS